LLRAPLGTYLPGRAAVNPGLEPAIGGGLNQGGSDSVIRGDDTSFRSRGVALTSFSARRALGRQRWIGRTVAVIALTGSFTSVAVGVSAAQAAPRAPHKAVVVKVVTRHPVGKMLATVHGRSLYILTTGSCNAACIAAWPRLLMPRGTTLPRGTSCLGTVKIGHRLQVTYRKKRLYLFTGDSGSLVTGDGVSFFKAARIVMRHCPR
jgi:hypothetical protein